MDRIPLYAKAGAVIPMWPNAPASTADYYPDIIELHLFVPLGDGRYDSLLVEDDGLTFAALAGHRLRTGLTVERAGDVVTLVADVDGEGFPQFRREAFRLVVHGAGPAVVRLDGTDVAAEAGAFHLPNAGTGLRVEFTV
jgi:alpha-glucosidase